MSVSKKLKVNLAQINSTVGDFSGNCAKILTSVKQARSDGFDMVIFPEMALCGYPPEDLLLKPAFFKDLKKYLNKIIKSSKNICVIVGFPQLIKDKKYNSAAIISDGKLIKVAHKYELPNYGVFDEKRYFTSADSVSVFSFKKYKIAVTICEDIWVKGGYVEKSVKKTKADITVNISASPFHAGKWKLRQNTVSGFAKRTKTTVLYTNLVGGQDELVFDGGSMVADSSGEICGLSKRFEEYNLTAEISKKSVDVVNKSKAKMSLIEEMYHTLILGTRDYILKNGFKKVAIGVSGGIDSALVTAIAVEAIGQSNVIGVTMPSKYSSAGTFSDAKKLADNLGIELLEIPIKNIFKVSVKDILGNPKKTGLETENLQARIRGNILMTLSNKYGWLVLSTGNKSEMAVGYSTLYGDMCGGYAVIKDVAKLDVFKLSKYFNKRAGRELIPQSTITRPPSAELRPDQKDEDSLPPYSILDPILNAYIEKDLSVKEIIKKGYKSEIVKKVIKLVDRSEFKRRQAPPGVKITPKAFGRDRRMPISNKYNHEN